MSNQTTLFHGGAYEITKAREPQAGLVVQVFDMEEDASSVAPMTPAEWDTFVAAGNAALGRPSTPLESRLLAAIEATDEHAETGWSIGAEAEDVAAVKGKATGLRAALAMVREQGATVPRAGVAAVLADIDALTGEDERAIAGIRASLAALLAPAPAPITVTVRRHQNDFKVYASYVKNRSVVVIDEHPGSWRVLSVTGDGEECIVKLESWRADTAATLEAAGLWPVAAPATTALRGELLMSGQTEAIDALDRLAKDGER